MERKEEGEGGEGGKECDEFMYTEHMQCMYRFHVLRVEGLEHG